MFSDLMIDLETLGTRPTCPVISLGAVFFDLEKKKLGPTFYLPLDVSEQIDRGRRVDGSTIKWWMQQDGAAKKVFSEQAKPVSEVLNLFVKWYKENNSKAHVWGNGATFDISIMENLLEDYGIKAPWGYNKTMDLRTYRRFVAKGERVEKSGVAHNALDDAVSQANFVMEYWK